MFINEPLTYELLIQRINEALAEYRKVCDNCTRTKSQEGKDFIFEQVKYATDQLLHLAKTIRAKVYLKKWTEHGRTPDDIIDDMLAWGQPYARTLFSASLRDKITDLIERFYGVSFSSLKIYPACTDKADGKIVYVAYNPDWVGTSSGPHDRWTLMKDGAYVMDVDRKKWETDYTTRPDGRA